MSAAPTGNSDRSQSLANLKPFQPGQSGNPSGRPKGVARQFRELINNDPTQIAHWLLEIAADPKAKDRITAIREYLDRAYGKAPAFAPVEGENPLDLDAVTTEIAGLVDELAARREVAAAGDAPVREVAAGG